MLPKTLINKKNERLKNLKKKKKLKKKSEKLYGAKKSFNKVFQWSKIEISFDNFSKIKNINIFYPFLKKNLF